MWHKPQLLTAVADLLLAAAAAAVLVALAVWTARLPMFPLREVVVAHELREVQRSEVEYALNGLLRGNFFSVNVDVVRQSLEKLPWVRRAEVRRRWPARLEVRIEEQQAVARWGEDMAQWVNPYGEVFSASPPQEGGESLPILQGPNGSSAEVLRRYAEFTQTLAAIDRRPLQLTLSQRLAWKLHMDDGMDVELGREQQKASISTRLARFVEVYPMALAERKPRPTVVDMRYPNGLALRPVATGQGN